MSTRDVALGRRLTAGLGAVSVVVSLGGIFVAAALAPWYSPFLNALSDLGALGRSTAPIFNGALVLGGATGAAFVAALWDHTPNPVHRAALVVLLVAMLFMGLTGLFPLPGLLHAAVAVPFFVFMTIGVAVWGAGDFASGRPARGGALVVGAVLHAVSWLWWALFGWAGPGISVPELVGSGALAVWALWVSAEVWPGGADLG